MRKAPPPRRASGNAGVRCAIYTRKSSEEGLEQAFNSLDAQREACEAYVLSQKHEGWTALAQMYDDGGVSGGTMERPALKRLLADIAAGKIDTVVVYKVDRLTRSLGDFAKIVEVFEAHGVSFVSVTQAFNTTSSMGRLTLNMLLSFAQFEREVTGERIRDKIAASKQKGMWVGGLPPLGYDVADRKLVINQKEAETVRHIFRRYVDLGSVHALKEELEAAGIVSKRRTDRFGRQCGGKPLARGALYLMLQNRVYRGEIVHKEKSYPGEHEPIIDEALWERVQARLAENRVERKTGVRAAEPSLLAGLIHDDVGERMTPTHANKKGTRYRYYVSQSLIRRGRPKGTDAGRRVPAGDLEGLVEDRIIAFLGDPAAMFSATESVAGDVHQRKTVAREAANLAGRWSEIEPSGRRLLLLRLVDRIDLRCDTVDIAIRPNAIPVIIASDIGAMQSDPGDKDMPTLILSIPARLKRAGMETRLLIEGAGGGPRREPDRSLLRLLARARRFQTMVMHDQGKSMTELADDAGVSPSYFTRVLRLSFLAPDIVSAILSGRQPPQLTAKHMISQSRLAKAWPSQTAQLGIA
jgi:DNA invertase Pin-like site-specific DNA recombinase